MHDDACQVLTFIKLRVGNVLGCAPAWCAKSRGAEEWGGTWHPSRKKQVEGCKVRIHGSSQTCFFAYHWHYKTIIVYILPHCVPQPLLANVKYAPQKAHTCFIHQAIAKHVIACSTALASWHWKPNMQMDVHAISCKYATWFQCTVLISG